MRRLSYLLIILIIFSSCVGCTSSSISENLTPAQKERDFQYLTDLISKDYPFDEYNAKVKGLTELSSLSADYVERAKNSKDDTDFMALLEEYLTRLSQTGHSYLVKPVHIDLLNSTSDDYKQYYSSYSDFNKITKQNLAYWSVVDDTLPVPGSVYPEISIYYDDGKYYVREDTTLGSTGDKVPKGSVVEEVEGQSVDNYVKSLQSKMHLNFDYNQDKLYLVNPLAVLPNNGSNGWNVRFRMLDGSNMDGFVSSGMQYKRRSNTLDAPYPNIVTVELDEETGYIKIFGMGIGTGDVSKDKESISNFLKQSQGKYRKLLIDIRGNSGGDPAFWMDLLVAPLIKEPVKYTQTAAVKSDFIQRWGNNLQRYLSSKQGLLTERLHFSAVKENLDCNYFDKFWRVFDVTREIKPKDSLPFNGDIYLLADGGSFSASEDFALFCKQTGFARVAGTRTGGGAAVFLLSHIFILPESRIPFLVEMEASLNPDGTINEIMGTAPDIPMAPQASPSSYKREALLDDKWIQNIMSQ